MCLGAWRRSELRVVLTAGALSSAERLRTLLAEYGVESTLAREPAPLWEWSVPGGVEVRVARFDEGFALPLERLVLVTEEDIFSDDEEFLFAEATIADAIGGALENIASAAGGDDEREDILNLDEPEAEIETAVSPS